MTLTPETLRKEAEERQTRTGAIWLSAAQQSLKRNSAFHSGYCAALRDIARRLEEGTPPRCTSRIYYGTEPRGDRGERCILAAGHLGEHLTELREAR